MDLQNKLAILADAAKYDASCASSGTDSLAFMLLDRASWAALEKQHCWGVDTAFERVTLGEDEQVLGDG